VGDGSFDVILLIECIACQVDFSAKACQWVIWPVNRAFKMLAGALRSLLGPIVVEQAAISACTAVVISL